MTKTTKTKKLPVPANTAKMQALSAARPEVGTDVKLVRSERGTKPGRVRAKKTGLPSTDAKTPTQRREIVKVMVSEQQRAVEEAAKADGLPAEFVRKPGQKPKPLSPEGQKRMEEAAKKSAPSPESKSAELLAEQKAVREQKRALKRAALKAKAGVDTKAMPLTGKAALRAINGDAIAKSKVEVTKVPQGMTGKQAARAAARAEQKAQRIANAKAKRAKLSDPSIAAHAEKVLKIAPRKPNQGKRAVYDWKGAREAAAKGRLPSPPDFSANTHRAYRPALAEVAELVKSKDLAGLEKYRVEGNWDSAKAIKRFREIALIALKQKQAS